MRLVFNYTWDEWRECYGSLTGNTGDWRYHFNLMYKPVARFSFKCLGVGLFAHLLSAALPSIRFLVVLLAYVLYIIAALGFLFLIYCVVVEVWSYCAMRKGWRKIGRSAPYRLRIDGDGILFEAAPPRPDARWAALTRCYDTERLHILCNERTGLAIPKRVLYDQVQETQFWRTIAGLLPEGTVVPPPAARSRKPQAVHKPVAPPVKRVPLWSFQGNGTALRSWRHFDDGMAEATVWFCVVYLPFFPLRKYRLRILYDPDREPRFSLRQLFVGLLDPHSGIHDEYEMISRQPVSASEVLRTYLHTYFGVPLILFIPLALIVLVCKLTIRLFAEGSPVPVFVVVILTSVWMGFFIVILAQQIHRSRGGRK